MAPATRMSGNFAASQSANLDHILENFNQFKRKHITQNRDIIKTNALAQLRIKELEDKVLQLEGERAEKNLELIRVRANMDRVERASKSVMRGWQLVGAGLAALNAIEGLRIAEPSDRVEQEARDIIRGDTNQGNKQSTRIVLDPQALPAGVARNVSRPPEAQLVNLAEEESRELRGEEDGEEVEEDDEQGIDTIEVDENGTMDETQATVDDETIRLDASNTSEQSERVAPQASSPLVNGRPIIEQRQHLVVQSRSQLRHSTSIDSLSSFADEEEVQLSDDLCDAQDPLESLLTTKKEQQQQQHDQQPKAKSARQPLKARKRRESTLSPNQSLERSTSAPVEEDCHTLTLSGSDEEFPQSQPSTRSSRRSSARDRKSVNYALPKLNTKMRKPDPADMIPAQVGETRRGEDGARAGASQDSKEETPKRELRGGSGVASTGNLREIAKQHQSARKEDKDSEAKVLQQQEATPSQKRPHVRRRSSEGRPSSRCSLGGDDRSDEWEAEQSLSEGEDTRNGLGKGRVSIPTSLPASWKANPHRPSSSNLSSKSAVNGTPIPRSQSGQNIKALKVANRIQRIGVGHQPQFKADAKLKVNGEAMYNGATATPTTSGEQVLNASSKHNQSRSAPSPSGENTKRNSLHAAMTLEREGQQHMRTTFGPGVAER